MAKIFPDLALLPILVTGRLSPNQFLSYQCWFPCFTRLDYKVHYQPTYQCRLMALCLQRICQGALTIVTTWKVFGKTGMLHSTSGLSGTVSLEISYRSYFWNLLLCHMTTSNCIFIRYVYIPLGGSQKKLLNVWVVFTFVAVWHDLEW